MTAQVSEETATTVPAPQYLRTVDRTLVHRWALSEVFLTDLRVLGPDRLLAAAQLPTSHAYYTDHPGTGAAIDPVLLLECSRQAATAVAHELLDVPATSAFLVSDWSLELPGPDGPVRGARPAELLMDLRVTDHLVRAGLTRGASFAVDLRLDGVPIGQVAIAARYTPAEEAALLRRHLRRSDPPSSTSLPAVPVGCPTKPSAVRRRDPVNVALVDAVRTPGRATALVAVPGEHPTHFDHPQDHFTAMTLVEAARQAAWLALAGENVPLTARVSALRAGFTRFAELDAPVVAEATAAPDRSSVRVCFRQHDAVVSEVEVAVAWPRDRDRDATTTALNEQEAL